MDGGRCFPPEVISHWGGGQYLQTNSHKYTTFAQAWEYERAVFTSAFIDIELIVL